MMSNMLRLKNMKNNDKSECFVTINQISKEFKAALLIAKGLGLKNDEAVFAANRVVFDSVGIDCIELFGLTEKYVSQITLVTDTMCKHFIKAIESSVKSGRRTTVKALKNRRPTLRSWSDIQVAKVIAKLLELGEIRIDSSKKAPAYFISSEW